jgi:hypothetical protein
MNLVSPFTCLSVRSRQLIQLTKKWSALWGVVFISLFIEFVIEHILRPEIILSCRSTVIREKNFVKWITASLNVLFKISSSVWAALQKTLKLLFNHFILSFIRLGALLCFSSVFVHVLSNLTPHPHLRAFLFRASLDVLILFSSLAFTFIRQKF